jgi:hypothetical protein
VKQEHAPQERKAHFLDTVRTSFRFLEESGKMRFVGVREEGGDDPRDHTFVARYECKDFRADIALCEGEGSLAVLLRYNREGLEKRQRYVYMEPLIEFLSDGQYKVLVPYVREGMAVKQLKEIMDMRMLLFSDGYESVIRELALRTAPFVKKISSVMSEDIINYHRWMKKRHRDRNLTFDI